MSPGRVSVDEKQIPRGRPKRAADELDVRFALPREMTREVAREKCITALAQIVEGDPR